MTPTEARQLWVQALRSGEFKQGAGALHIRSGGEDCYCCLGVACEVYQKHVGGLCIDEESGYKTYNWNVCTLPTPVSKWLDIGPAGSLIAPVKNPADLAVTARNTLVALNDICGYTFDQIADVIESGNLA